MIEARAYRQGDSNSEAVDPQHLGEARGGPGTLLVVDAVDFSDDDLQFLARELPIHPLALDDLRNANQRTKLERYGDHWHVAVHAVDVHGHQVSVKEVDVLFGEDWLLAVRQPAIDGGVPMDFAEVQRRFLRQREESRDDDLGCALWALLDVVVDGYFTVSDVVDERLEDIEEIVFGADAQDAIPQDVFRLRRKLVRFRRAAAPLREVISALIRREVEWIGSETVVLLQDVYDHSLRIADLVDSQRDLLTGLLEAHLAVVSNRMNDVMKKTSSWGAILLVSTLIAGIYGMNFDNMPELQLHYGYYFALATMGVATILLWLRFRRRGWL
jgi:magnesium transporter